MKISKPQFEISDDSYYSITDNFSKIFEEAVDSNLFYELDINPDLILSSKQYTKLIKSSNLSNDNSEFDQMVSYIFKIPTNKKHISEAFQISDFQDCKKRQKLTSITPNSSYARCPEEFLQEHFTLNNIYRTIPFVQKDSVEILSSEDEDGVDSEQNILSDPRLFNEPAMENRADIIEDEATLNFNALSKYINSNHGTHQKKNSRNEIIDHLLYFQEMKDSFSRLNNELPLLTPIDFYSNSFSFPQIDYVKFLIFHQVIENLETLFSKTQKCQHFIYVLRSLISLIRYAIHHQSLSTHFCGNLAMVRFIFCTLQFCNSLYESFAKSSFNYIQFAVDFFRKGYDTSLPSSEAAQFLFSTISNGANYSREIFYFHEFAVSIAIQGFCEIINDINSDITNQNDLSIQSIAESYIYHQNLYKLKFTFSKTTPGTFSIECTPCIMSSHVPLFPLININDPGHIFYHSK